MLFTFFPVIATRVIRSTISATLEGKGVALVIGGTDEWRKKEESVSPIRLMDRPRSPSRSSRLRRGRTMKFINVLGGGGYMGTGLATKRDRSAISRSFRSRCSTIHIECGSVGLRRSSARASASSLAFCN